MKFFYWISKCSECKHSFLVDAGVSVRNLVSICGSKDNETIGISDGKPRCKSVVANCVSFEIKEIK